MDKMNQILLEETHLALLSSGRLGPTQIIILKIIEYDNSITNKELADQLHKGPGNIKKCLTQLRKLGFLSTTKHQRGPGIPREMAVNYNGKVR